MSDRPTFPAGSVSKTRGACLLFPGCRLCGFQSVPGLRFFSSRFGALGGLGVPGQRRQAVTWRQDGEE